MRVLGIETSCDETAVALIECSGKIPARILAEEISSQTHIHEQYGGVVPELAAREHLRNLPLLLERVLSDARLDIDALDLIAVTRGPGLKGCLLIGLDFAKGLALGSGKPLLGVNHIEGHILSAMLDNPELEFPFLALIVSGGHTEILDVRAVGDYRVVARTKDDAAGEAFDKSANLLGFTYPGGAKLAALADSVALLPIPRELELPQVMRDADGFSFSGLKTAIALKVKKSARELQDPQQRALLAKSIQSGIVSTLTDKLSVAITDTGCRRVVVSGGVSANRALREAVSALPKVSVYVPSSRHCMDNAAMIAYTGALRFAAGERGGFDMEPESRWPVERMRIAA